MHAEQVTRTSKPCEKRHDRREVKRRDSALQRRPVPMCPVAEVKMSMWQVYVAGDERENAQQQPDEKTDEIKSCPAHNPSPPARAALHHRPITRFRFSRIRLQNFHQPFDQFRRLQDVSEQHQATSRVRMFCQLQQRVRHFGVATESLGPADQPQVQLVFHHPHIRGQVLVIPIRVIDEVARMHLEKPCQQQTRLVGQVRPCPALDLRKVRLADALPSFLANRSGEFLLCHLAIEAAKRAFDLTQVANFFPKSHITDCNYHIAICNCQEFYLPAAQSDIRALNTLTNQRSYFKVFLSLTGLR